VLLLNSLPPLFCRTVKEWKSENMIVVWWNGQKDGASSLSPAAAVALPAAAAAAERDPKVRVFFGLLDTVLL